MKHLTPFILLCTLILCGCGGSQKKSGPLPVIDLNAQYPKKDIVLQEIADVEYISLNGKDAPLIGTVRIGYISNECYILYDIKEGDVFVLEKNGKVRNQFNFMGSSGKEYTRISHLTYDPKKREIYISDATGPNGILVYTDTGTFVRSFPEHAQQSLTEIYDFDDHTLFGYFTLPFRATLDNLNQTDPYVFLSKEDGSIVSRLPLHFPERLSNRVSLRLDNGYSLPIVISTYETRKYGDHFLIADLSADTIYTLSKDRKITPVLTRTPSVYTQDPFIAWSVGLMTDKFICIGTVAYDFEAIKQQVLKNQQLSIKAEGYLYYIANKEIIIPNFINTDWPSTVVKITMGNTSVGEKNMSAIVYQAEQLVAELEKGKLTGKLKEVAQRLKADDNPVLMVVRYK